MPAARAAPSREAPSSTSARASIRRAALASRHRAASRRSSTAPGSFRVIATVMAPPLIGHTADQPRQAPRGSERDDGSAIRAVGITPKKYQSGETDVAGGISKAGGAMVRTALYEAANVMLTRTGRFSTLKRWGLEVAKGRGMRRAKVALARKLATVLHRLWVDGGEFRFGQEAAAA